MAADGDHYRIAFDKPNTWSQKYNLVWDKLLGLDIFPPEVARQEVAYYKTMLQRYGVPLDSRTRLTKTDWCLWSATLADDRADFEAIVSPIYDYLNETTARLPFVDSYVTDNARSDGMRARPVIGGVFIKMLEDPATWKKWASRDQAKVGDCAPAPCRRGSPRSCRPRSTSRSSGATRSRSRRATGPGPVSTTVGGSKARAASAPPGRPGIVVGTTWNTPDIWLRREVTLPASTDPSRLQLLVYHDEDDRGLHRRRARGQGVGLRHELSADRDSPGGRERLKPARRSCSPFTAIRPAEGRGLTSGWSMWMSGSRSWLIAG